MRRFRRLQSGEFLERRELLASNLAAAGALGAEELDRNATAVVAEPPKDLQSSSMAARATSDSPTIALSGTRYYRENAPPTVLAPNADLQLAVYGGLAGSRLVVNIASNSSSQDRLALRISPEGVNVKGIELRYGQELIGQITGGVGTTPLVARFNAQATLAEVNAVLRSMTFRVVGDAPASLARRIHFQFSDGAGRPSNIAEKRVVVQPVNDPPHVGISGGSTFQAGSKPIVLAPFAELTDPDTTDFSKGRLLVTIAKNIEANDRLYIQSQGDGPRRIKAEQGFVYYEGRLFATYFGGAKLTALSVTFLGNATPAAIQQLLRRISFETWGNPPSTLPRTVTFEMSDHLETVSRVYKTVDGQDLTLDITRPAGWRAGDRRPAIMFVGGTWTHRGKNWWNEHSRYLASRGVVSILATYRTIPLDSTMAPDAPAQDLKSALRWIRYHAKELGVDPNRIGAIGASAGGQLAAATAMMNGLNDPQDDFSYLSKANALLMFNGVVDTGPHGWGYERVGDRYRQFSPVDNASSDDPPTFIAHGTDDGIVFQATVERFKAALDKAGVSNDVRFWEGQQHGFMNVTEQNGRYFYETLRAADAFLAKLGWTHGAPTLVRPAAYRVALGFSAPWNVGVKQVKIEVPAASAAPTSQASQPANPLNAAASDAYFAA